MSDKKDDVEFVNHKVYKDQFVIHSDTERREPKEHEITRFHLHIYEREGHSPVFLVEEAENNKGPRVNTLSEHLAKELKGEMAYNLKPDDLVWYEQKKEGDVERVHFCTFNMDLQHPKAWGVVHREESSIPVMLQEVAEPTIQKDQEKQFNEMHAPTKGRDLEPQVKAQENSPQPQQQDIKKQRR